MNPVRTEDLVVSRNRRHHRDPALAPTTDIREELLELEHKGELIVHRVPDPHVLVGTKYGRQKKIPMGNVWHHKSCGQCGHIPGYPTSIIWLHKMLGLDSYDPTNQTSCTGWNYYASATSNSLAQVSVACRNFAAAYKDGFYPLIHCGTSFGHYKDVREELVTQPELRREVRKVMEKLGYPLVFPEEIVHYSEWVYAVRNKLAALKVHDVSGITACVHPACHYHKLIPEDVVYDDEIYNGERTAVITGLALAFGAKVGDYSTWYDCCGFGFRHILVSRDFTRSFAARRKIEVMINEANPDVVLAQDTGCVTSLDKSQFAVKPHGVKVGVPVISDAQFAALAMGAHPFRVVQIHWHATDWRPLLEKMGIDWQSAWEEFQEDLERIKRGEIKHLEWGDVFNG